jgi:hypothetical protein
VDDEHRPWWTRPPEPGPQTRKPGDDDPSADPSATTDLFAPANPNARERFAPTAPPPVAPYLPPSDPYAPAEPYVSPVSYLPPPGALPAAPAPATSDPTLPAPLPVIPGPPAPTPELAAPALAPPARVVRRVAVPQSPRSDDTETLPAVDDDIFATFTGEIEQVGPETPKSRLSRGGRSSRDARSPRDPRSSRDAQPGHRSDGGSDPADPSAPPGADLGARRLPPIPKPDGRVLLLAGAGGLVVLLIVLVAMIFGQPSNNPTASPPKSRASTVAAAVSLGGTPPSGLQQLSSDAAATELRKAGKSAGGTIVEAWSWTDNNGKNLVVSVISPAPAGKQTLRVIHLAKLDTDHVKTLRIMRDPRLPDCGGNSGGTASFTKNSMYVRDLNSDGIAEVTVGWSSRCGGEGSKSEVKLAVISNGHKYIIRGQGVIGSSGSGSAQPDPRDSHWPKNDLDAALTLYHHLYF